jgi:putative transposase
MKTIKRAKKKYSFEVNNFCIMGNHFHLIIKPKENQNLSRIMQWILSVYAIQFNKRHGYKGHVWYDRFRSKVIYSYWQYVKTFIYIANNPVRAGITNSAVEYRYNGISFIQKGVLGIMEPLSRLLVKQVWRELVAKGSL